MRRKGMRLFTFHADGPQPFPSGLHGGDQERAIARLEIRMQETRIGIDVRDVGCDSIM
jgi:hypothetical protein